MRFVLIGCSDGKTVNEPGIWLPAGQMYCSQLFEARKQYALSQESPWQILSAKHGVLNPSRLITWYDVSLKGATPADRAAWSLGTALQVVELVADAGGAVNNSVVEIHAGRDYSHPLSNLLDNVGFTVELPLAGLSIGLQLQWYTKRAAMEFAR